jgi:Flp pilus assembly protein TadB
MARRTAKKPRISRIPSYARDCKTEPLIEQRYHCPDESMEVPEIRTWVIFYLLSFVVLLVAIFITTQNDGQRWVSLMLVIVVVGVNSFLLASELKRHQRKKAFMRRMSKFDETEGDQGSSGHRW